MSLQPKKGQVLPWRYPDRQQVGRLKWDFRRFEKRLLEMDVDGSAVGDFREKMQDIFELLDQMNGARQ
jgi:hypothetical protein